MFSGCLWDWESIDSIKVATHLWAGWQTTTITHLDGCQVTDSIYINEAHPIMDSIDVIDVMCATDPQGLIYLHLHDSILTTVGWSTGSHEAAIDSLDAGTYYFDLSDSRGCFYTDTVTITVPDTLVPSYTAFDVLCYGDSNGYINGHAIGGFPNYNYAWSNGDSLVTADSLSMGYYDLVVTDSAGCQATVDSIFVGQPGMITLNAYGWNASTDSCMGSAEVMATGGVGSFTYLWNDPMSTTTYDAHLLCAGSYTVTVTDSNGCVMVDSVTVSSSVGMADALNHSIVMYPNPVSNTLFIQNLEIGDEVAVYNSIGQLVHRAYSLNTAVNINVGDWAKGQYIVQVIGKGMKQSSKISVKH